MTAAEVVTPWDAWFAWLERERPMRAYELPLADKEDADGRLESDGEPS